MEPATKPFAHSTGLPGSSDSALLKLPDELLLDIADFLNVEDLACLSLVNHSLRDRFARCWQELRQDILLMKDLLVRLARDLPSLFCCHDCVRLHPISKVPIPSLTGHEPPKEALKCVTYPSPSHLRSRPHHIHGHSSAYQLAFQHAQLVMADRMSLDKLSTTEVHELTGTPLRPSRSTTLLSVDPRIIGGQLYLRVQQWTTFHNSDLSRAESMWNMAICGHINWNASWKKTALVDLLRCKLYHKDRKTCRTCMPYIKCAVCAVEFQIDVVNLPDCASKAVVLTKWLNLGHGADPSDPQWLSTSRRPDLASTSALVDPADPTKGARADFESSSREALSAITKSNGSIILHPSSLHLHPASTTVRRIYTEYPRCLSADSATDSSPVAAGWWIRTSVLCVVVAVIKFGEGKAFCIIVGFAVLFLLRKCLT